MPELWIVMKIGCIKCGVSSELVGVYDSKQFANALADSLYHTHSRRYGRQYFFEVFPLGSVNETKEEFLNNA